MVKKTHNLILILVFLVFPFISFAETIPYHQNVIPGTDTDSWEQQTKTNRAIKYLQLAEVLIDDTSVKEEISKIIKYLSYRNLNGDTFSQYAKNSTTKFINDVKSTYLSPKTTTPNNHVILDTKVRNQIKNLSEQNNTTQQNNNPVPQNNNVPSNNNTDLNQMFFNLLNNK
jgi:hypothetical protein